MQNNSPDTGRNPGMMTSLLDRLPPGIAKQISSLQWRIPLVRKIYVAVARRYVNRDGIIKHGPAQGLRFNGGGSRNAGFMLGTYEPGVQRALVALIRPAMTVYDIGANMGFLSVLAARLTGPQGRVISFEPVPQNAERVDYNAFLNSFQNISVIREALGAENRSASFQTSAESGWGRVSEGREAPLGEFLGNIEVQMRTLPDSIVHNLLPSPDVIKIDIEGAETELLRGAHEFFLHCRPALLIELHGTNQAVAQSLKEIRYDAFVIGETCAVSAARWDAFVIACPAEQSELCALGRRLAIEMTPRR